MNEPVTLTQVALAGVLSVEEYEELMGLLHPKQPEDIPIAADAEGEGE